MFESLSEKLQNIIKKLKQEARITEEVLKEVLKEIKFALLEADVNYKVVKELLLQIESKALGQEVINSLTPGQQVVKIVQDELTNILGDEENINIKYSSNGPSIVMIVGIQGSGKTTFSAKLANYLRKQNKKPLLVGCDVYRPAAMEQLRVLAASLNIDVYIDEKEKNVLKIAKDSLRVANSKMCDLVIIDTAGRLQIDETLMDELLTLTKELNPSETILVVDAMTGQEAVNVAQQFDQKINIDSIAITKLDSDTRGGAALSVKYITGKPIKFASVGEKLNDLEPFYPKRIASRILGMGDVLTMVDKALEFSNEEEAIKLEQKIRKNSFTLDDYLVQIKKIKKMGANKMLAMMPGVPKELKNADIDESRFTKIEAIISSMTIKEREDVEILNASRRKRIASGSGTEVSEINRFVNDYIQMKKIMKDMLNGKNPLSALNGIRKGFR